MLEMNFEIARHNMIEQQIRPWNVIDPIVLSALDAIPRENYVPDELKTSAFSDVELPIGHNQSMLCPKIEARILQSVQLKKTDKVLEVGTGSGYMTALLAHLAEQVHTVEINEQLSEQARQKITSEGFENITFAVADAAQGYTQDAPYDVIIITGALSRLDDSFKQSLKLGGRLFVVLGTAPVMEATLITRVSTNHYATEILFETEIPELENAPQKQTFML